jgi:hypothetical protein
MMIISLYAVLLRIRNCTLYKLCKRLFSNITWEEYIAVQSLRKMEVIYEGTYLYFLSVQLNVCPYCCGNTV